MKDAGYTLIKDEDFLDYQHYLEFGMAGYEDPQVQVKSLANDNAKEAVTQINM